MIIGKIKLDKRRVDSMLIDSETLKTRLKEVDEVYSKFQPSGIPSYSIFKSMIEGIERETLDREKAGK